MTSIVCLDIETTGLDPQKDAIIEIGAVRFNEKRIEAEWTTLVNPGRPIPANITALTHITNEMVRNAPRIGEVTGELASFAGDLPVLGHNVGFDLGFLRRQNILTINDVVDTYELAATLLPTVSRYNLEFLRKYFNVPMKATHLALDDARATHGVFVELYRVAWELNIDLLAELVRLSEGLDWGAGWVFSQILRARLRENAIQPRHVPDSPFRFDPALGGQSLTPDGHGNPLDVDEAAAVLEYGGPFSHYFSGYEYRAQQVEMLRRVATALSDNTHLLVEAGTGTGKSFAYLIPAALWALQNETRVVISTNTITLQEQLIKKDIPDLCAALKLPLQTAVLKGRSNYLCPRRLELLRKRGPENVDEMRVCAKVLVWMQTSQSGDRSEINLNGPADREVWMRLSAEDEGCKVETCIKRGGACPFYRAHVAAQNAHLLVVNHALLLADAAVGNRVLPPYNYAIVDEAHHLEAATTNALSFRLTEGEIPRLSRDLGSLKTGIFGRFMGLVRTALQPSDLAALEQAIQRSIDLAFRVDQYTRAFFESVRNFLADQRGGRPVGQYAQQERILPGTRTLPAWNQVEVSWDQTSETFKLLLGLLTQVHQAMGELVTNGLEDVEDVQGTLSNIYRRLAEIQENLDALITKPSPAKIYWIETATNQAITLNAAPLHIGQLMEQVLWHEKSSIILTSATLTTGGEFDYLRGRLNADEADELTVGSPFDYETAALLYAVNDIPEPADNNGHQRAVEEAIRQLAVASQGRMLVLFTSFSQLKRTAEAVTPFLDRQHISVFAQSEGVAPNMLVESFRETERAVLLGTRSLWEGVDIAGEALSVLVIVKLPFDVPSDPIVAARSETFEDPFNEYSLPEAILRFRQGFGRLIRTQSDRGAVVILDKRVLTKTYGKLFIDSLPECTFRKGTLADAPRQVEKWLNM